VASGPKTSAGKPPAFCGPAMMMTLSVPPYLLTVGVVVVVVVVVFVVEVEAGVVVAEVVVEVVEVFPHPTRIEALTNKTSKINNTFFILLAFLLFYYKFAVAKNLFMNPEQLDF
jgi:hypothetical protein